VLYLTLEARFVGLLALRETADVGRVVNNPIRDIETYNARLREQDAKQRKLDPYR